MPEDYRHRLSLWLQAHDRAIQLLVVLAAVGTVPILVVRTNEHNRLWLAAADWSIWIIFTAELALTTIAARDRLEHLRRSWLGVGVVCLSFPLLPQALAATRLVRVTRLARLARATAVAGQGIVATRRSLGSQSLIYMSGVTLLLTLVGGAAMSIVEPEAVASLEEGLWWAVVTVTTVGYGDVTPETPLGRGLAVVLMLCGLGLVSTLAAAISALFIQANAEPEQDEIADRLARIEAILDELRNEKARE